jgi:hypothetical protein
MSEIIAYDAGREAGSERYTVLVGNKVFILGTIPEDINEADEKGMQILTLNEVDPKYMDKTFQKIPIKLLPTCITSAIRRRLECSI